MISSIRKFFFGENKKDVLKDILEIALESDFEHSQRKGIEKIIEYCEERLPIEDIEDSVCG